MPLDIPNLDDRRWADLVEEARGLIPRVSPQWTDHNAHDPGITFIELFAWLAELQLYQLNRVGDRHVEAFARLAGVQRRPRTPARLAIRVDGTLNVGVFLPAGTQLTPVSDDSLVFETDTDVFLTASRLRRVVSDYGGTAVDQTTANERAGTAFLAFGESAAEGASLRLGFDSFYPNEAELRLAFDVFIDDLLTPCEAGAPSVLEANVSAAPPVAADLVWEYWAANGWSPLDVIGDTTHALAESGVVTLATPQHAVRDRDLVWIRARIAGGEYDIEPRLRNVTVNVLPCSQKETVRNEDVGTGTGRPDQVHSLKRGPLLVPREGRPAAIATSDVADWQRLLTEARRLQPELASRLFAAERSTTPDHSRIRELNREAAATFDSLGPILGREPVVVTVDDELWQRVESFADSNPTSKHFVLDVERGALLFGNGLNGRIPSKAQAIRAVWYQTSAGSNGNVATDQQWRFRTASVTGVTLRNRAAATGGADRETTAELELRAQANLRRPERAVTLRDLERLALATPHVHVARAKAIAHCPEPEAITVVVLPKVRPGRARPRPRVSETFLTAVRRQLDAHRLLCDNVRVIGPVFVEVRVTARLRLIKAAGPAAVLARAQDALDRFLRGELELADGPVRVELPTATSPCLTRWPFGRAVVPSEIYAVLDTVQGVDTVWHVALTARRGEAIVLPDASGAIRVPPVGLVIAGVHDLAIDDSPRSAR